MCNKSQVENEPDRKDPGRKRAEVKELGVNVEKDPGRKELTCP